ncbi:hypothetical protein EII22_00565 [Coriobacteriales bacterium OH1046]|nr:hypothetical protein EII22_00565 [Coriobacteriales bacterium OH1046]
MRRLKGFIPLAAGLLIHLYAMVATGFRMGSGLHQALSGIPWTTYEGLVPLCELMQRILCAYLFFLVMEVLGDTWILRRVLAAAALAWLYLLVSCTLIVYLAVPLIPEPLSLLVPIILLTLTIWVALTYARECGETSEAHGSAAAR